MQPLLPCLSLMVPGCAASWRGPCFIEEKKEGGPERGRGLAQSTQQVNDRATDCSFRTVNWMVNFPNLPSPPPNKYLHSSLPLASSVSHACKASPEAARFIRNDKDFRITLTSESHTCCKTLDLPGLIFLSAMGC